MSKNRRSAFSRNTADDPCVSPEDVDPFSLESGTIEYDFSDLDWGDFDGFESFEVLEERDAQLDLQLVETFSKAFE